MHGIVFAKQGAFSLLEKHTINSSVSVILKNTYSTFHVDNCKHSVAAFVKFSDKIFTDFTVLQTSQLYKNNIKYHNYNLHVCGKPY